MHQPLFSLLLLVGGLACAGAFLWGAKAHFRSAGPVPLGMKLATALTAAGVAWFVLQLVVWGPGRLWPLALGLFLLSFTIFLWSVAATQKTRLTLAFETDEPKFLLHDGPYRYVRHPFYLSYLTFWTATALAVRGPAGWVPVAVMLALYWLAARREERKFAHSRLRTEYDRYRSQAGMFLPHPGSVFRRSGPAARA